MNSINENVNTENMEIAENIVIAAPCDAAMPDPTDTEAMMQWVEDRRRARMTPEEQRLEELTRRKRALKEVENAIGPLAQARRYLDKLREESGIADEGDFIVSEGLESFYDALRYLNGLIYSAEEWFEYDHGVYRRITGDDLQAKITEWLQKQSTETPAVTPNLVYGIITNLKGLCRVSVREQIPYQLVMPPIGEKQAWVAEKHNRVVFDNGVVDLDDILIEGPSSALEPFSADWVSLTKLPYNFDPEASCELWSETLAEIFPRERDDDHRIEVLQEFFGWCLGGSANLEAFLLLHGEGANGKTVVLNVLEAMIGSANCSYLSLSDINNRFMLGALAEKMVNISGDMTRITKADEGRLKMLVSGNPMTVDRKNKEPVKLAPTAKMIFACNELPAMSDKSDGIWRRAKVIPFLERFEGDRRDTDRAAHIIEDELAGVFMWALEGLRRLMANGGFTDCGVSREACESYRLDNDNVRQFFQECCELRDDKCTSVNKLYDIYANWCDACRCKAFSKVNFGRQFSKISGIATEFKWEHGHTIRIYKGLNVIQGAGVSAQSNPYRVVH